MVATEAQKRAFAKRRLKLKYVKIDFNIEKKEDMTAFNKFSKLSKYEGSKKKAFIRLIDNIDT